MEELKNNENLTENLANLKEVNDRDSEIQDFNQTLDKLNEEYLQENQEAQEPQENQVAGAIQGESSNAEVGGSPSEEKDNQLASDFVSEPISNEQNQGVAESEDKNETREASEITSAFEKEAEKEGETPIGKNPEPDAFCEVEYKQIKLQKLYSKIVYDLTDPALTVEQLKERITDCSDYSFATFMLLTSKIKGVKKALKGAFKLCAVIGLGESTELAKRCEIKQAKALKVNEIQVIMPLSIIKEGKKRLIAKEFLAYKKLVGSKIAFTVVIDGANLSAEEYSSAIECAVASKANKLYLKNTQGLAPNRILSAVKTCQNKCDVQIDLDIKSSADINYHSERGVDFFTSKTALALAQNIKHEEN